MGINFTAVDSNPSGIIELWKDHVFLLKIATSQQKTFCVLEFEKTNAIMTVQRTFKTEFDIDPPHCETIRRWVKQFKQIKCLCKRKSSEKPLVAQEQMARIHNAFKNSSLKSTRGINSSA